MATKASPVKNVIKGKPVGKRKPKQLVLKQSNSSKGAGRKTPHPEVDLKRQLKIQKALYEIADAASAVRNMQSFYRKLHKIVGKLMYAENFFIALYDEQSDLITWPYHADVKDTADEDWSPQPLTGFKGGTGYIIRSGRPVWLARDYDGMLKSSQFEQMGSKSVDAIGIPLKGGKRILGAIVVQSYSTHHTYTEQDEKVLSFVAQHITTALTRARALEAERQRNSELQIINSIQQALASELDFQAIVDLVGDKLREVFHTESLWIAWHDDKTNLIHSLYCYERGKRLIYSPAPPKKDGVWEKLVSTRQPLLLNTVKEMEAFGMRAIPGAQPSKSMVRVPIIGSDRVLGSISIDDLERENAFGESEIRLMTTIAASLGTALENARLFDETQRLLKETEERNAELAIINSIQQGLASELEFQALVALVGDKLREVFQSDSLGILVYDDENDLLTALYAYYDGERHAPETWKPRSRKAVEQVATNRQSLIWNTRAEAEEWGIWSDDGPVSFSGMFVPVMGKDKVVAAIRLTNDKREYAFNESDVRLVSTVGNSMGVALENARLFDEVQKRNLEISEALKQQTATSDVLRAMSGFQPDLRSLLEIIGDNIAKVCDANDAHIYRVEGKTIKEWTHRGPIPGLEAGESLPLNRGSVIGRAIIDRQIIHIHDAQVELNETEYPVSVSLQRRWGYRTVLATPLLRDGEPIGGIAIRREEVQPFTDKQIELIKTFADQAVIAIENVRLFDETQRLLKDTQQRNAELAIINAVQRALAAELDIHGIYDAVGEKLREIFDAQTVSIYSASFKKRMTTVEYNFEKGQKFNSISVPFNSLHESIIESDEPFVRNGDFPQYASQFKDYKVPAGEIPLSVMSTTVCRNKEADIWVGVSIQDMDGVRTFSESDVRLLETLASSMSVALENARLFDETQRLLRETEQRAAELQIINSIQEGLAKQLDFQGIIDLIGDKVREIFNADATGVGMVDSERDWLLNVYYVDRGERIPIPDGPVQRPSLTALAMDTHKPLLFGTQEEMIKAGAVQQPSPGEMVDKNESFLGLPILSGAKLIGVISVQSY
ncbi:MAG TPA: GAF domain-containing protein, partial [Anaerolineales bacterium]